MDKEIQELIEAVVLPMTHKHMFDNIGIRPPKGILLHGPPGTGKTLLARACAKQTDAIFLKLAGPQLVQVCRKLLQPNGNQNHARFFLLVDEGSAHERSG